MRMTRQRASPRRRGLARSLNKGLPRAAARPGATPPLPSKTGPRWAAETTMIHQLEGDLLLSKAEAIAHGVAPADHFAQGLALALRDRYPSMVKDFRHWCHQEHPKAGEAWTWSSHGVRVVNLLTQDAEGHGGHPGKASLANVNHALKALRKTIEKEGFKSVALPRLATGVGGLDWAEVEPLLVQHLGDLDAEVYVYATFRPGVAAVEPTA
jgi:O-acetyl-ADP-ribose deacetylase (regulator of RNase III)